MKQIHVLTVAALLGLAAILGVVGATRTAGIGAASQASAAHATSAQISARERQLRLAERQLAAARRNRPPALPRVPVFHRSATAAPVATAAAPRVVYQRPAPILVVRHLQHGDDSGYEHEQEGGGDD
jgi:hypothetical protein